MAQFRQSISVTLPWTYTPVYTSDPISEDGKSYICVFSAPKSTASVTRRFDTSTIPDGATLQSATLYGTVTYSRGSGGTWGSSSGSCNLTVAGTTISGSSFSLNAYSLLSGMSGGNWWNLGVTCVGGTAYKEYAKAFSWDNLFTPPMSTVWSLPEISVMTSELGNSGVAQSGSITISMTLTVYHSGEKEAGDEDTPTGTTGLAVNYGTGGKWQKVQAFYGTGGAWKPVLPFYGTQGKWVGGEYSGNTGGDSGGETDDGTWVLFDSGYVDGVTWEANGMTRPNYTAYGTASLKYVEENGEMMVGVSNGSSTYYHYGLLNTADPVKIPAKATAFNVRIRKQDANSISADVGLVLPTAANSTTTTNGGVMSGLKTVSNSTYQTITVTLPEGMAGSEKYVAVINARGQANATRWAWVDKVWFT